MKRSRGAITAVPPPHIVSKRWTFFCAMLGFLMLPFMPVQFTSILTAVVWIFSGVEYALIFTVLGTFRLDSVPIFSGLQNVFHLVAPTSLLPFSQSLTILVMFFGNLAASYLFKTLFVGRLMKRLSNFD